MEQKRYDFILEARQPIAHHSETFGNSQVLMRQRVRRADGSWARVPIITGDTMRHGLREAATWAYLDCAGMLGETLTESALRLLFAGGMVTGSGATVKLDEYREMCDLMPHLTLLGGCAGNRVVPGQIHVEPALLLCDETRHLLPEWVPEWVEEQGAEWDGARSHVEEVQRVRMDPTLDPSKARLLTSGDREGVQQRLIAGADARKAKNHRAADEAKSSMMPRRFETVCAGSWWYWSVTATVYSELELDTLNVMVATFLRDARVGGKRGTGNGLLVPRVAQNIGLARWKDRVDTLEILGPDQAVGAQYRRHVEARAERIREWLQTVAA